MGNTDFIIFQNYQRAGIESPTVSFIRATNIRDVLFHEFYWIETQSMLQIHTYDRGSRKCTIFRACVGMFE